MSGVGRGGALRLPASVPRTATCGLPVDAAKEQSKIFLASSFCTRGPTKTRNKQSFFRSKITTTLQMLPH
jgi:hypothetical protein